MRVRDPILPQNPDTSYAQALNRALLDVLRPLVNKVNALGSGSAGGIDNAATAAPTTGTYAQGDFIKNSNPTELGAGGSKYVLLGWISVAGGTPGTFRECRVLTGN